MAKKKIKNQYYIKENRKSFLPCRIKKAYAIKDH